VRRLRDEAAAVFDDMVAAEDLRRVRCPAALTEACSHAVVASHAVACKSARPDRAGQGGLGQLACARS
jgi:hypothetical protein